MRPSTSFTAAGSAAAAMTVAEELGRKRRKDGLLHTVKRFLDQWSSENPITSQFVFGCLQLMFCVILAYALVDLFKALVLFLILSFCFLIVFVPLWFVYSILVQMFKTPK